MTTVKTIIFFWYTAPCGFSFKLFAAVSEFAVL